MPVKQAGVVMQTKVMAEGKKKFWKIALGKIKMRTIPEVMPCEHGAGIQGQSRAG